MHTSRIRATSRKQGNSWHVAKLLGSGGQGEVYLVEDGLQQAALKLYHHHTGTPQQREIVELLVRSPMPAGPAAERFVWPRDLVEVDAMGRWGYIMPLVDRSVFVDLGKMQGQPHKYSLYPKQMAEAGYQLANSMRALHLSGRCYRDISRGNILFHYQTGDIRIIDNDNIIADHQGDPTVLGTYEYMAPEILLGQKNPSSTTDLHSLAVLLFELWMWHHPFHGNMECQLHCLDAFARTQLYAKDPVFIFHPEDKRNYPGHEDYRTVRNRWGMCPPGLKNLFIQAFTRGMADPRSRVTEGQWQQEFLQLSEGVISCSCQAENIWEPGMHNLFCWNCGKNVPIGPKLAIDTGAGRFWLLLRPGLELVDTHLNPHQGRSEKPKVLGRLVENPNKPGQWGIQNHTPLPWTFTPASGNTLTVPPMKSAPISKVARILIAGKNCSVVA